MNDGDDDDGDEISIYDRKYLHWVVDWHYDRVGHKKEHIAHTMDGLTLNFTVLNSAVKRGTACNSWYSEAISLPQLITSTWPDGQEPLRTHSRLILGRPLLGHRLLNRSIRQYLCR